MSIDTVIFLGAGASKSEGAPLQSELFKEYFGSEHFRPNTVDMDRDLAEFFAWMFNIDVRQPVHTIIFPTFEEVLGLADLAILRKEAFRQIDINSGRLRRVAQSLVFLVAKLLARHRGRSEEALRYEEPKIAPDSQADGSIRGRRSNANMARRGA